MKIFFYEQLDQAAIDSLTKRPIIDLEKICEMVKPVMNDVQKRGDEAVKAYAQKFDNVDLQNLKISASDIKAAIAMLDDDVKEAIRKAALNIEKFHKSQVILEEVVETMPGVICFRQVRPIEKIGFYIPGGTASLPSTVLMLGIPAKIAGCKNIILCSPPKIAPEILFAADLVGVNEIYQIGGAQAIAAMTYGTETVESVYKIFGPGNQYVTAAKMLANLSGVAIDMPAGPSEVLVIADEKADISFIAADLLSQAEHGADSQVVLVTLSETIATKVIEEIKEQLKNLPRKEIIEKALLNSFILICQNLDDAILFANNYAPEHLILNVEAPEQYVPKVTNAGSVFLGGYSCESAGDYASGTNHALPTYGYAKAYSGVSVDSFVKKITFQKLSAEGVKNIGPIVEKMAECELLLAHKNAMTLRLNSLKK